MRLKSLTRSQWISYSLLATFVLLVVWLVSIHHEISERIDGGWFQPPVELYSDADRIRIGTHLPASRLLGWIQSWGYQPAEPGSRLIHNEYRQLDPDSCAQRVSNYDVSDLNFSACFEFRTPQIENSRAPTMHLIGLDENGVVRGLFMGEPLQSVEVLRLPTQLYAQFYNGKPILRTIVPLGKIPLQCLQAVTAIEDKQFLFHSGVSPTGILRAAVRNVTAGGYGQGGSTITQQLVKNYFLTPEKTMKRKFVEVFMSLVLETKASKDKILETYLNVIYMGQTGPFQVIGIQAASEYYFRKDVSDLSLNECALLAAIINSPGKFNPFRNPENAKTRRNLVLTKMQEIGFIDENSVNAGKLTSLPSRPVDRLSEPAAYYTQAVFRELEDLGIDTTNGLRVYTSLNESAQEAAQTLVAKHVERLETGFKSIQEIKKTGKNLEAALISVDTETAGITALVGGRKYVKTQFNRVLDGHRQVGSVMKPFVYLAALESRNENGELYSPMSMISDEAFTHKYEGQSWSPRNYDKISHGEVPLYVALKDSYNIATARLGLNVGLSNVIDVARRAGIQSDMEPLPSLTLGSFEIVPIEIAQAYLPIARMGTTLPLHTIERVETLDGELYYEYKRDLEQPFSPHTVADLVAMMKQTIESGTARLARAVGLTATAAGKTGTTSDTRDAWFVGFTPKVLAVTWVGYDDNTPTGLTGASGALPLWIEFMKSLVGLSNEDFQWPEGYSEPSLVWEKEPIQ